MKKLELIGKQIMIVEMKKEPEYTGKKGVVTHIDDIGQIHGTWGGCAIIPDIDKYIVFDNDQKHKENVGYEIIESITMPEEDYVLGVKEVNGKLTYVTWMKVRDTYYHGHYIDDYNSAKLDLYERVRCSLDWYIRQLKTEE